MLNIPLTILCSTSIALILKHNETKSGNPMLLLAGNYLVASIISCLFFLYDENSSGSIQSLLFSAVIAVVFVGSFFSFTKAVSIAGTALATISSRISVIVPVLLSVIIFSEQPEIQHIAGFVFTITTLYFFYKSLNHKESKKLYWKDYLYLSIVFLGIGMADFGMKIFEQWRPISEKSFFLFGIFGFSFMYTFGIHTFSESKFDARSFIRGNFLGIHNMFSSFFLIGALSSIPAIIVYPVTNIGIITLTTLGAYVFWKERLNVYGSVALGAGIISIILLSL